MLHKIEANPNVHSNAIFRDLIKSIDGTLAPQIACLHKVYISDIFTEITQYCNDQNVSKHEFWIF